MGGLFANRGLLATAWFIVVAAIVGGAGLALLQRPPPPSAPEPVVVALPAPPGSAAMEPPGAPQTAVAEAAGQPAETPPAETPPAESSATGTPAGAAEEPPAPPPEAQPAPSSEAQPAASPEAQQEEPVPPPPPESSAQPQPESQQKSQPGAKPDAQAEAKSKTSGEPAAAPEVTAKIEAPLPVPKPEPAPKAAPAPKTEPTPEAPAPKPPAPELSTGAAPAPTGTAMATAPEGKAAKDQVVNIPVIPPAPDQLPYWERYRQPFNMADKRPRIAVVMTGLGLSDGATEAAINKLPPAVTLSFSPYTRGLQRWIALARSRGHEVMMDLPMEPATFPNEDPGPQGLLTSLTPEQNLDRLAWVLSRGSAYVGLAGSMGSRFTSTRDAIEPILEDVKKRGLMFLDRRTTNQSLVTQIAQQIDLPSAFNNRTVDERQASRVAIDARLAQIERVALTDGYAVAMAQPYPVTLERLAEWATELTGRGFVMAPISALANLQKAP